MSKEHNEVDDAWSDLGGDDSEFFLSKEVWQRGFPLRTYIARGNEDNMSEEHNEVDDHNLNNEGNEADDYDDNYNLSDNNESDDYNLSENNKADHHNLSQEDDDNYNLSQCWAIGLIDILDICPKSCPKLIQNQNLFSMNSFEQFWTSFEQSKTRFWIVSDSPKLIEILDNFELSKTVQLKKAIGQVQNPAIEIKEHSEF
ncbi:hypothetical protein C1645_820746 [Glomus cerebriforme]|uniref:Uncharacterized protein n=1 Tax=Glomus cerebriforme TaxID=658196 RepID=A0A397TBP1_9GLOM|nr:hypothetical protein C1645_820746 [Glomus cerebriforme]